MANVAALSSRGIRTALQVVVDRDHLGHIYELIADFKACGLEGDGYNFGYHFAPVQLPHAPEREVTSKEIMDALVEQGLSIDDARVHVPAYRRAWDSTLHNMEKRYLPSTKPSRCSAIDGRMGVDPERRVYRCFHAVGRDDKEAGIIEPDGHFVPNANAPLWQLRDATHMDGR